MSFTFLVLFLIAVTLAADMFEHEDEDIDAAVDSTNEQSFGSESDGALPNELNVDRLQPDTQDMLHAAAASQLLVDKLLTFAPPNFEESSMKAKIEALGLETLSDLKYVEDLDKSFSDVLKPVGIGKLKHFIKGLFVRIWSYISLSCYL